MDWRQKKLRADEEVKHTWLERKSHLIRNSIFISEMWVT